jgi:hypothetical protein
MDEEVSVGFDEAFNKWGDSLWHVDQVETDLDLQDKFLLGNDGKGAEFSCVVLVVEVSQAGDIEVAMEDPFVFTQIKGGGGLLTADQSCEAEFVMELSVYAVG